MCKMQDGHLLLLFGWLGFLFCLFVCFFVLVSFWSEMGAWATGVVCNGGFHVGYECGELQGTLQRLKKKKQRQ